MNEILERLKEFFLSERGVDVLMAIALFALGLLVARIAAATTSRLLRKRMGVQSLAVARRLVAYSLVMLFTVASLKQAGFDLSVLLGAAGVLTVAVGFASQTSVSNLISGMFLMGERAIEVGEVVTIGDVTGEVLLIDWMSVKLRTFDNLLVRLPNETVLKAKIINLNRFPIRRLDQQLSVAYGTDLDQVRSVLTEVAHRNPLCLDEPQPILFHQAFGQSSIDLQYSVWHLTPNRIEIKNQLPQQIAEAFAVAGIEIPFPQRVLTFKQPLPVAGTLDEANAASFAADSSASAAATTSPSS